MIASENAIRVEGLGYSYRRRPVLEDVTLDVPRGAVYGFLGPNGSGKTTAIRLLMGLLTRGEGSVEVLGIDPRRDPVALKRVVGYIPEQQSFYSWMRVEELMGFVAHYRSDWDDAYAEHLRQRFDLDPGQRVGELSRGERAMVALLLALAFRPPLLVFDEPTSALDPGARRRFFEGVLAEYQEDGGTVFVSSHLIHEIAGFVDHVGILDRGRLVCSRPLETLQKDVRRYRLTFAEDVPTDEWTCPGRLALENAGRECVVTVDQSVASAEAVREALQVRRPSRVDEEPLTLEEIFLAMVGQGRKP